MSEANPHVLLVGHPPVTEFLALVNAETLERHGGEDGALMNAWPVATITSSP